MSQHRTGQIEVGSERQVCCWGCLALSLVSPSMYTCSSSKRPSDPLGALSDGHVSLSATAMVSEEAERQVDLVLEKEPAELREERRAGRGEPFDCGAFLNRIYENWNTREVGEPELFESGEGRSTDRAVLDRLRAKL